MLSRKYYKMIAEAIYNNSFYYNDDETFLCIEAETFMEELADLFKQDNINFDKEKFIEACKNGNKK